MSVVPLMAEDERIDLLEALDCFTMSKIMFDEGLPLEDIAYFQLPSSGCFKLSMSKLQGKYPYFKIRQSKDYNYLFIFSLSLPRALKKYYKAIKKTINNSLDYMDSYVVEIESDWRCNEFHFSCNDHVKYSVLLEDILTIFKEMRKIEVNSIK
ncbi:hypothetical protein MOD24_17190 [Bacillus haynesii]|uniref:hypothetical protein n=1 Tax=Bacillus haynesii TaxID=1925021 RepID=UPI0022811A57|nr:hypothetical protein [Bacillus haynesii]MCY8577582.1 hypothetical protein [Bacillus haynesii]MEC1657071.1 hypothetical protein [Bacillus haynesii]